MLLQLVSSRTSWTFTTLQKGFGQLHSSALLARIFRPLLSRALRCSQAAAPTVCWYRTLWTCTMLQHRPGRLPSSASRGHICLLPLPAAWPCSPAVTYPVSLCASSGFPFQGRKVKGRVGAVLLSFSSCLRPPPLIHALFADGYPPIYGNSTNVTDAFNAVTGAWSTTQLSEGRFFLSATTDGNVAIFAGGVAGWYVLNARCVNGVPRLRTHCRCCAVIIVATLCCFPFHALVRHKSTRL